MTRTAWPLSPVIPAPAISNGACRRGISKKARPRSRPLCAILGEVIDSIATIDYWFTGTTQRVHKLVHHFALKQTGGELTVEGDPDHEAEDAIWVRFEDLDDVLSYPNERKIAWLYARKKNRQANE